MNDFFGLDYEIGYLGIPLLFFAVVIYFIPSLIARARDHNNLIPIFIVNLFFGWSFLGWVVSLVWSFTNNVD